MLDVAAEVPPGITVLFGASGSGKTSVLRAIAGLLAPDEGDIQIAGKYLFSSANSVNRPPQQRRMGYVFQNLALFPHLTAEENIAFGLLDQPFATRVERVDRALQSFRIEHLRKRKPKALSGGEQQRVAIARALVTEPQGLLLDEPLSALDPGTKSQIISDLRAWISERNIPVLYVTHSREEVFALAARVIAIGEGRIVGQGSPREVLGGAQHEAVAAWSALENVFTGTITSLHEQQGTMTFRTGKLELEVPLSRARVGDQIRIGIGAHDILLATTPPQGVSARNIISGRVVTVSQRDALVSVQVDCSGTSFEAHVTPASVQSLRLLQGTEVWVVIKTHSCFLIRS
jgi:molybdate transport system ATP-binding protein